jgi:cytoskeletal protein CcmA (bactofilin family)
MFDKKPKPYTDQLGKTNRIVEGTIIKGDILSKADFRLDGDLIGNFQSNGKLVIGPAGSVKGDIVCRNADIEGRFDGRIQVEEVLSLKATSVINGETSCGKLSVEPGAEFNATCVMKPNQNKLLSGEEKRLEEKN